ncbi:MAG TPA: hypothetical protein VH163_07635 [Gemmatimonadales bacterium]|nr:hypothetical protein [Gemmatimonadales bacterium]
MRRAGLALLALAVLPAGRGLRAQYGYFGENKVQFKEFDWRVMQGPHVDLHYYPAEEELARVALAYAEESYAALSRRFNYEVPHRVPLIVYASHTDFEQTNILPYVPPEGLLGVTDFAKERVTLPFTGSYYDFKHTIRHELVHVFQISLEAQTFRRYPRERHAALPLWWTEGLAEYFSIGTDNQGEMILREITVSGQLPTLEQLNYAGGGAVYPVGAKIHQFLADSYGEWRILEVYDQLWKYDTFDHLMEGVYGQTFAQLSEAWQHWMRQKYYPAVEASRPLALDAKKVGSLAIKPAVVLDSADTAQNRVLYFSPADGYTDIYSARLDGEDKRAVVKGERTPEFESFHFFDSRLDVYRGRLLAFTSKYLDRDALFVWDLRRGQKVGRFQFPGLVGILSPSWTPDGQSVVFSGLADNGYADLYRLWIADGRLERLTNDRYQDVDPSVSPDGKRVVFSSDRTSFGIDGARNLFTLDLASGAITYLTYGDWKDSGPRWDWSTDRIWFASDRGGASQVYDIDSTGAGRRVTAALGGAFDPQYVPAESTIVFSGFSDLSFGIYRTRVTGDTTGPAVSLAANREAPDWAWPELAAPVTIAERPQPYRRRFTLDFAAGDAIVVPGLGAAQGADFLFSDLLEDHLLLLQLSSFQGNGLGNFFGNINGTLVYLNQTHRINWGVGAFRLRGTFFEGDLSTVYDETSTGVLGQLRYPFDRFRRLELEYRLEHSDRFDFGSIDVLTGGDPTALHRVGWLSSNYLTYVKDNTLWLDTGPIDGERYAFTAGVVNDVSHGRFDSWVGFGDYRRYLRTSLRSGFAFRAMGYYGGGERPRETNIGGSWGIRGYPYYGYIAGTRAWMLNLEWRFPITDYLDLGFPFGPLRFPGVQGAFFVDDGRAWTPLTDARASLGSSGLGLRMPLGPAFVLRLDMGYRFSSGDVSLYSLPANYQGRRFVDFFFGFNY